MELPSGRWELKQINGQSPLGFLVFRFSSWARRSEWVMKGNLYWATCIRLVKIHSISTVKIDYSSFKVVMRLYTGMLELGIFQVGFYNLVLGKGGGKSASTVSFHWELLEACNFAIE